MVKYDGDIAKYPEWQDDFKDFLEVADHRWRPLLEAIEEHTSPLTNANYVHICVKAGVTDKLLDFQKQLHSYMKTFTSKNLQKSVTTGGADNSFAVWRQMAELGRSRRPEHLLTLRAVINQPGKATMANLVTAINAWEANKGYLTKITGKRMDDEDERLILIQMCPEALEAYLRKDSTKRPTYQM